MQAIQKQPIPKVLYFSSAAHVQGGAVQSMFRLARWVKQQGGEPVVVLPRPGEIQQWYARESIDVRVMPFAEMHPRWSPFYLIHYLFSTLSIIARLVALIKREGVAIVHVNEIVYYPGLIAGKLAGARTICHVRVILERPAWLRHILRWLVGAFADTVLCVSDAVRTRMFSPGMKHVRTLYNPGPDLDRFDPQVVGEGSAIRRQLGIAPDAFVVGLVSKLSPNKGHLALVEAAGAIKRRCPSLPMVYLIVGGEIAGKEGYAQQLCDRLKADGLQDAFILAGVQSDVPKFITACDVMVHLPSIEDPFPGVVLEAMSMAKPIVAFASGGIPEQFEDGKSGILVEKNNTAALADTLLTLAGDHALRAQIGQHARPCLTARFSFKKFFGELNAIYHTV